jgi:hypothetical protein
MGISVSVVLAVALPFAGVCVAWGALMWRVGRIEKDLAKLEDLPGTVSAVDAKIETVRTSQGVRLGEIKGRVDKLEGFQAGYAAIRRKTRANEGIPEVTDGGER